MGKKRPTPPGPPDPPAPLTAVLTGRFKRSGKNVSKLTAIMATIIERRPIDPARGDHPLKGEWKGCRDCHVEGDWVLIYETTDSRAIFHRTGTYSEVFGR